MSFSNWNNQSLKRCHHDFQTSSDLTSLLPCNNSIEQSLFPLGSGATCVLHTMTGRMLVAACQTFVDTKSVDLHKMDRKWQQPELSRDASSSTC